MKIRWKPDPWEHNRFWRKRKRKMKFRESISTESMRWISRSPDLTKAKPIRSQSTMFSISKILNRWQKNWFQTKSHWFKSDNSMGQEEQAPHSSSSQCSTRTSSDNWISFKTAQRTQETLRWFTLQVDRPRLRVSSILSTTTWMSEWETMTIMASR